MCVARATRKSVHVCLVLKPASSHVCKTAKYSYRSEHPVFSLLEAGGEHPWKDEDQLQLQAKEEKNRRGVPHWAVMMHFLKECVAHKTPTTAHTKMSGPSADRLRVLPR